MHNLIKSPPLAKVSNCHDSVGVQTFIAEKVIYKPVNQQKRLALQVYAALATLELLLKILEQPYLPPKKVCEQINVYINKIKALIPEASENPGIFKEYFDKQNFTELFPRACQRFCAITRAAAFSSYADVVKFNEIANVALQIQNCLLVEDSHRFLPHQLAILFRLVEESGEERLGKYLARIEAAFVPVTTYISKAGRPLPSEYSKWLDDLVCDLVGDIYYLDFKITPYHAFLHKIISDSNITH